MICTDCGNEQTDGKFCVKCGSATEEKPVIADLQPEPPTPEPMIKTDDSIQQFEYKAIEVGESKGAIQKQRTLYENEFNDLGKQGWDLVVGFSVTGGSATSAVNEPGQVFLIFKRPLNQGG